MRTGVIRLFRFAGIDVYLHFTWFLVAAIFMTDYVRRYESPVWGVRSNLIAGLPRPTMTKPGGSPTSSAWACRLDRAA